MEKNTILFNGVSVDTYTSVRENAIISLLVKERKLKYKDNPPVAAIVNGELKSLMDEIPQNAHIETVKLFSPLGRRVYRKTLCFLLCYASSVLFPERSLVIGHSLGDGYYFSYRNKEKPDVAKLKAVMKAAIKDDMNINIVTITSDDALYYAKSKNLTETEKLLSSRNDGSYRFSKLGTCMEMYYEPMLPSTKYLEVWDLIEYEDGLLLRYPQSRNDFELMPFENHPLLFSVFSQNKKLAGQIDLQSLGALNEKQTQGHIEEIIMFAETMQRRRFAEIGKMILDKEKVKIVFIAGPSSSGKTTSSLKLCNELKLNGYAPLKISMDDYYLPYDEVPVDENGEKNFEVLESLNLELFRTQIASLLKGEEVHLSSFSIKEQQHHFRRESVRMTDKTILVIEGIHGLNPDLLPDIDRDVCFKIYISALTQLNLDSRSRISTTDNRILRRLVRDYRTRGISAVDTLSRWPSVERGEKRFIFPFQNNADVMINSALEYEIGVLSTYATPLLRSVKKEDGSAYTTARRLLSFLKLVYPIPSESVPNDSLLREFIGGSVYDVY